MPKIEDAAKALAEKRQADENAASVTAAIEAAVIEATIEELKEQARAKPGTLQPGTLVEKLRDIEGTMTYTGATKDSDQEYVRVYSTLDNMPSDVLVNMLSKTLRKRWPQHPEVPSDMWDKPVFSLTAKGEYRPTENPLVCLLHPTHEKRAAYDAMGLKGRTCRKANLNSEYHLEMHMRNRHKNEYSIIKKTDEIAREADTKASDTRRTNLTEAQTNALLALVEKLSKES